MPKKYALEKNCEIYYLSIKQGNFPRISRRDYKKNFICIFNVSSLL